MPPNHARNLQIHRRPSHHSTGLKLCKRDGSDKRFLHDSSVIPKNGISRVPWGICSNMKMWIEEYQKMMLYSKKTTIRLYVPIFHGYKFGEVPCVHAWCEVWYYYGSVHFFVGMELWAKAPYTIKIFWNGGDAVAAGRGLNTPVQNGWSMKDCNPNAGWIVLKAA